MADPILVSFALRDVLGKTDTHKVYLDEATTGADIELFIAAYAPLLDLVTGSAISKVSYRISGEVPAGVKTDPLDDYFNWQGGNLSFGVSEVSARWTTFVPAYLRTLFSGKEIPNVGATADLITELLSATNAQAQNEVGFDLTGFLVGKLAQRAK